MVGSLAPRKSRSRSESVLIKVLEYLWYNTNKSPHTIMV